MVTDKLKRMDKLERAEAQQSGWIRPTGWSLVLLVGIMIFVLFLAVIRFAGLFLVSDYGQVTDLQGERAAYTIANMLHTGLPDTATDITYYEVSKGFDPYEATITFKAPPDDYTAFINRAELFCFATPLPLEGDGTPADRAQCRLVHMNITLDKTDPALWQVKIFIDSFH